ncbi:MAG: hypothetical protein JNM85_05115 [Chthonomonas sp.]|nr:hypothetical protein [Chthonomonas sp.]
MSLLDLYQVVAERAVWFLFLTVPSAAVVWCMVRIVRLSAPQRVLFLRLMLAKATIVDLPLALVGAGNSVPARTVEQWIDRVPVLWLVGSVHCAALIGAAGVTRWALAWRQGELFAKLAKPGQDTATGVAVGAISGLPGPVAWRKSILVPAEGWSELEVRHELSHVQHGDTAWNASMSLACSALWWNPAIVLLHRELQFWHEVRADEEAVDGAPEQKKLLADQILKSSSHGPALTLQLSSAGRLIRRRVKHLFSAASPEASKSMLILLVLVCLGTSPVTYLRFFQHKYPSVRVTSPRSETPVATRMPARLK